MFGLSWIGDGATIKQMPLVNMLEMFGKAAPVDVLIRDCTSHMKDGRKKMQNSLWSTLVKKWMSLIQKYYLKIVFLWGNKCSKSRFYPLCKISKGQVFSWMGTCAICGF